MESPAIKEIYIDNNATTIPRVEVREAVLGAMGPSFGNPSSVHSAGDRGRTQIREARTAVTSLIGTSPENLIFTSGGTESNSLVLSTLLHATSPVRLITTTVEHSSVLRTAESLRSHGVDVVFLPVDIGGRIELERLEEELQSPTQLVSIQWANNETGVIQPIEQIAEMCADRGVPFHSDAAQAVGKLPVNVSETPIDYLTLTAHKIHGPQGVGALFARDKARLRPQLFGGDQEFGLRAGTQNLPGIVGMGVAAQLRGQTLDRSIETMRVLRDEFEQKTLEQIPSVRINGAINPRLCNTSNLQFAGRDGQALVALLDQDGIRCSQSSACTNQRPEPSYVLTSMGLSESEAYASIRFGFSELNSSEEIDFVVDRLAFHCQNLHSFRQKYLSTPS